MAIIYRVTAEKDGITHVYIGQTKNSLEKRRVQHEAAALRNDPTSFHQELRDIALNKWVWKELLECDASELNDQEKRFINIFREEVLQNSNVIFLNNSVGLTNSSKKEESKKINYGIPKANKQKNYTPSQMGNLFLRSAGKLKPVINLASNQIYTSILEAERSDFISRATIKISCTTGKMLKNGTRYAYIDIDDQPILTEGHGIDHYIGKNARKIKELVSNQIFNSAKEAAQKYELSETSIGANANGTHAIAKGQYVFCYLDQNNNEIKTAIHEKALERIRAKNKNKYVGWPVNLTYKEAKEKNELCYFKTLSDLYQALAIKSKCHVKEVCDGKRSHVEMYRIAYYEDDADLPQLTQKHNEKAGKIVRKVHCLNDGKSWTNCTEAGNYYKIAPNQIGMCAKGELKSVRVKDETGKTKRFQFQYLDKDGEPIVPAKHREPLSQRKGVSRLVLLNPHPEIISRLGTDRFSSLSEFCKLTKVPHKAARRYLNGENINLHGYEFIKLD